MDIADASALGATNGRTTTDAFSAVSSEEFTKIIFAELSRQDPLKPNDTSALLEQLATLRSIQSNSDLSASLESLVGQNEFATAGSLIGRRVTGIDDAGERVTDVVAGVSRTTDGAVLTLVSGTRVSMSRVDGIVAR